MFSGLCGPCLCPFCLLHRAHVGSFLSLASMEIILGLFKPVWFLSLPSVAFSPGSVQIKPGLVLMAPAVPWVLLWLCSPTVRLGRRKELQGAAQGPEPGTELLPVPAPSSVHCAAATADPPCSQSACGSRNCLLFFQIQTDSELFCREILPVQHLEKNVHVHEFLRKTLFFRDKNSSTFAPKKYLQTATVV